MSNEVGLAFIMVVLNVMFLVACYIKLKEKETDIYCSRLDLEFLRGEKDKEIQHLRQVCQSQQEWIDHHVCPKDDEEFEEGQFDEDEDEDEEEDYPDPQRN